MKATVVRALTGVCALMVALAVGYSVQPAGAAPAAAPLCVVGPTASTPIPPTPLARGHLVAI
jgi:hypothetical protein